MCADEAEGQGWSAIAAFAYQHRGRVHYDAGEFDGARRDFKRALFLRQESGAPTTSSSRRCSRSMPPTDAGLRHPSPAECRRYVLTSPS